MNKTWGMGQKIFSKKWRLLHKDISPKSWSHHLFQVSSQNRYTKNQSEAENNKFSLQCPSAQVNGVLQWDFVTKKLVSLVLFCCSGKISRSKTTEGRDGKFLCLVSLSRHGGSLWGHNAATECVKMNSPKYWHCLPSLPDKMIAQTGLCFSPQTPSCLGMATPCKAAHRPTPSETGKHHHPPLLSERWFLVTHLSFQVSRGLRCSPCMRILVGSIKRSLQYFYGASVHYGFVL